MDDILSPLTDLELWRSDPFKLKDKIKKFYVKGKEIIDLSRGDPIDPPGLNADQVFNYFQHLSILIQEEILERHEQVYSENIEKYIKHKSDIDFHWIEKKFKSVPTSSNIYNNVIYAVDDIEKKNGKTQKDLLIEILKCNRSSGYGDISGEDTVRQILAAYLNETSSSIGGGEINKNNLILTLGGSECISVIFKVLNSINFIR